MLFDAIVRYLRNILREKIDCPTCGGEAPKIKEWGRQTTYECVACGKIVTIRTLD